MHREAGTIDRRQEGVVDDYSWIHDLGVVDMDELSSLYRVAPLGNKLSTRTTKDAGLGRR